MKSVNFVNFQSVNEFVNFVGNNRSKVDISSSEMYYHSAVGTNSLIC